MSRQGAHPRAEGGRHDSTKPDAREPNVAKRKSSTKRAS